jgi:hypothetical protein
MCKGGDETKKNIVYLIRIIYLEAALAELMRERIHQISGS